MSFVADKQTLEDLNLLGKYKQHSVFNLFNKVKTAGGEKLLGTTFQSPLVDQEAINRRSAIFQYFQSKQITFPFSNEQFSQMENYLGGSSANNHLATWLILAKKKLLGAVVRDEEYQHIQTGIQQTTAILNRFKIFISQFDEKEEYPNHSFYDELLTAKNILNDPKLQWLTTGQSSTSRLSLQKTAKYNHLLRHTMRAPLTAVMDTFYQLDLYIAVAGLAQEKGFSYAHALPAGSNLFKAVELSHPCIEKAVANPIILPPRASKHDLFNGGQHGRQIHIYESLWHKCLPGPFGFPGGGKGNAVFGKGRDL